MGCGYNGRMGNAPASDKRDCSAPVGKTLGLPEDACCLKCGYLLRGLSKPRCPECGRYFDRADPCTYGPLPRRVTRWQQRYAGTPSWPKVTVIFAASLYFLEGSTRPGAFRDAGSDSWQLTAALWLGVALDYAVTIAASVSSAWQMGRLSKGQRYGAALRSDGCSSRQLCCWSFCAQLPAALLIFVLRQAGLHWNAPHATFCWGDRCPPRAGSAYTGSGGLAYWMKASASRRVHREATRPGSSVDGLPVRR
jgi:hypothetical protein